MSTARGMRHSSSFSFHRRISLLGALLTFLVIPVLHAQEQPDIPKPVPVIIGGAGFITTFDGGEPHLGPLIAPVLLVPIGDRWLIESRATFEADMTQEPGSSSFHGQVLKSVDYLQLDFIANPYVTVTAGRFLTPFGIFNERLYPIWIRNLQTDPLILPIGTGPSQASTGAMVRGGFPATSKFNINYTVYFSALSTVTLSNVTPLDSDRLVGGRAGIFIPMHGSKSAVPLSICSSMNARTPSVFMAAGSRRRCPWNSAGNISVRPGGAATGSNLRTA